MRINRGRIKPDELEGASFTVSHIATPSVHRFMALPNRFQSAILAGDEVTGVIESYLTVVIGPGDVARMLEPLIRAGRIG